MTHPVSHVVSPTAQPLTSAREALALLRQVRESRRVAAEIRQALTARYSDLEKRRNGDATAADWTELNGYLRAALNGTFDKRSVDRIRNVDRCKRLHHAAMQMPLETPNVLAWYEREVQPLLEQLAPQRARELAAQARRVERLVGHENHEVAVCFLGQSGIGKSTLINAIVGKGQVILPAGGIGPLTAQALAVRYAQRPSFEVVYQGREQLRELILALDRAVAIDRSSGRSIDGADTNELLEHYARQARTIVCGDQHAPADLAYVVDGLLRAGGWKPRLATQPKSNDQERLRCVSRALQLADEGQAFTCESHTVDSAFMTQLRCHAAGFLSPLIKSLELGWPSHVLHQGLRLVDLPGVGISGDSYRLVTEKWVRERARAVCLVVNRGLDSDSVSLLRGSGFLERLMRSATDPSTDPVKLFIAVTKLDETAGAHYQEERQSRPALYRPKREHLAELQEETVREIRAQLAAELKAALASTEGTARVTVGDAIERVVATVRIFPLTAHEFTKLMREHEDDPPFIKEAEESGVPAIQRALSNLVEEYRRELGQAVNEAAAGLREACRDSLATLHAQFLRST